MIDSNDDDPPTAIPEPPGQWVEDDQGRSTFVANDPAQLAELERRGAEPHSLAIDVGATAEVLKAILSL